MTPAKWGYIFRLVVCLSAEEVNGCSMGPWSKNPFNYGADQTYVAIIHIARRVIWPSWRSVCLLVTFFFFNIPFNWRFYPNRFKISAYLRRYIQYSEKQESCKCMSFQYATTFWVLQIVLLSDVIGKLKRVFSIQWKIFSYIACGIVGGVIKSCYCSSMWRNWISIS